MKVGSQCSITNGRENRKPWQPKRQQRRARKPQRRRNASSFFDLKGDAQASPSFLGLTADPPLPPLSDLDSHGALANCPAFWPERFTGPSIWQSVWLKPQSLCRNRLRPTNSAGRSSKCQVDRNRHRVNAQRSSSCKVVISFRDMMFG
jgi:hypothetical protein